MAASPSWAGEPGIGKSRLIWALQQHVAQSPDAFLIHLSCSPYFVNTAFYPIVQLLERILEFRPDDTVEDEQRLDKIEGLLAQYGSDLPTVGDQTISARATLPDP